ncbi:uncharacterized protein LOC129611359 [Condylostylus longicornis]|uniref:uncharacterized protein LOC129611359 n=1 Tax=Condylostylus longicornis TaxID=2530218 RepID=UPI00244E237F|nr:uncharacterized protein LOC129611359 [Condylostylus longicornis]
MVMQKILVILFHQQLILRYGIWALRTTETQSLYSTKLPTTIFINYNQHQHPNETTIIQTANHITLNKRDDNNITELNKNLKKIEENMQQENATDWKLQKKIIKNSSTIIKEQKTVPPVHSSLSSSSSKPKKTTTSTTKRSTQTTHHYHPPLGKMMKINSIVTNCTRDLFQINVDLGKKFRGIFFAKDFVHECRIHGNYSTFITLQLPTSGCGVRSVPKNDGTLEYSVKVMLQMDEKLRQSSDILKIVKCTLPTSLMSMDVSGESIIDDDDMKKIFRNGRMRLSSTANHHHLNNHKFSLHSNSTGIDETTDTLSSSSTSSSSIPRVRIWLELGANNADNVDSGAVQVGQPTTLAIRAVLPGTIGVRIIDCAALDGLGDSSQQLLDQRGCPVDEQVMPALQVRITPAEEGWSKPHQDDLVEKLFTATFPAFKFPDRERLHVSCGVQLCKGACPSVNCETDENLILTQEKQLARIEVFNSLAVTAPQIELDRYRQYDRRYNISAEEYPPRIRTLHSDGTLCLSISNLALAFCILGLIFLLAVIVAVCCLIKSRSHTKSNNSHRAASTSAFSTSSDSAQSARGTTSKLLIPYYAGTLPYGRVY